MRKIKWGDLVVTIGCLFMIYCFVFLNTPEQYASLVQQPYGQGSGSTGSMIFYFVMYKIDQWIGKTGVICFFLLLALFFLYHFLNENMPSFKNRYRDYKETGDWKKLLGK
ncbi:hypothetical protein [Dysgonomonas sp. 511]|uniref:hypothetical protein n=1 Tax=Dysgonomonas sp. 511 TaxID=2302930 RepID=UPI0013CF7A86|nr:hypothetical protein [Dysgonomonas sp. 511]NDV79488.1 hypothetical protein [Dysgonomonas sp. 511]